MKILKSNSKFLILSIFCSLLFACATENKKNNENTAYLFTYFTGNGAGEEAIRYAISSDGYNFHSLNNNEPIVASDSISRTGGVRDPHILRKENNDGFYMVVTDLLTKNGWSNTAMSLLKSDDLLNWSSSVIDITETFPEFSDVTRVWAPQTIYDAQAKKYMVYFSMLQPGSYDKIYYAYVNDDFTALESTPKQLFFNPNEKASIDGDIIKKDDKFYLFYKTEGDTDKGIKVAISDSLTSGYKAEQGNVDQTDKAVEGSGVFKLNNSQDYILMYDMYTSGKYQFTRSADLKNFEVVDEDISMNFHPRHGTVLPISSEELQRLLKEFPSEDLTEITGAENEAIKSNNIVIKRSEKTVYLPVKYGTDLSNFDPKFDVLPRTEISPNTAQDFSNGAVAYEVTNGENKTSYQVNVEVANNPVVEGYYADPEIIYSEKDSKYYLYPTSDGFDGWSGTYFKTFSSPDLVNWTDEGVILDLEKDVEWTSRNAWAPTMVEKEIDGKFKYFYYFTAAQQVGVATSDNPKGTFKDSGAPLISEKPEGINGGQNIDPDIFVDPKSGKNYLYWGNGFLAVVELNDDMVSIKDGAPKVLTPDETFREGVEVFFRNDTYYFLWSEDDTRSPNYKVRYATAKSPLGPLNIPENNIVIQKDENQDILATGHNSVIKVHDKDEFYLVYHRFTRPKGEAMGGAAGFHREVAIDRLNFTEDGLIEEVKPTLEGIKPVN
ncbi:family 43 glycosylhydrolase [Zunongwangia endophytica]|uniref:Family 43 glycosylhydrolase n=1 Tax=Zunongwangia endophytica TaxID=1808945 RepID=A0ABV8H570_9FLAO|nr:family 43 glycosylhydrolase [Zunongwangia endophytica]MDN3595528.1 family 43 glycosylhydrolase [Zunongwangia endophytica]